MASIRNPLLSGTPEEMESLERLALGTDTVSLRAQIVLARIQGRKCKDISDKFSVSESFVYHWLRLYRIHGAAGILNMSSLEGRPRIRLRVLFDDDGVIRKEIRLRVRQKVRQIESYLDRAYTYAELSALTGLGAEAIYPLFRGDVSGRLPALTVCLRAARALNVHVADLFVWNAPGEGTKA